MLHANIQLYADTIFTTLKSANKSTLQLVAVASMSRENARLKLSWN